MPVGYLLAIGAIQITSDFLSDRDFLPKPALDVNTLNFMSTLFVCV